MPERDLPAALRALHAAAGRATIARRLEGGAEQRLLQSIVDATVHLFDAEASSIALFERDPDRLEFRVASGAQGAGAIGLSVTPTQGIAGYVFSTGQPLALSNVAGDPRFDRRTAERTGYVPRSIAAVPLVDEQQTLGVLQVLDKRGSPSFSLREMELLAIFAAQATAAIGAARVQRDGETLLREILRRVGEDEVSPEQLETLREEITTGLDRDTDDPLWQLVERVSRLRELTDRELALVADILGVIARHARVAVRR